MLRGKYIGVRREPWESKNGQRGERFYLDIIDGGLKTLRIDEEAYRSIDRKAFKEGDLVELVTGYVKSDYEGYFVGLTDVIAPAVPGKPS